MADFRVQSQVNGLFGLNGATLDTLHEFPGRQDAADELARWKNQANAWLLVNELRLAGSAYEGAWPPLLATATS